MVIHHTVMPIMLLSECCRFGRKINRKLMRLSVPAVFIETSGIDESETVHMVKLP